MVGIIYPFPEVRNITDKTANFVTWNGHEFEARVKQNKTDNPKFYFPKQKDPWHAYYHQEISEFKDRKAQEPLATIPKIMQQQATPAAGTQAGVQETTLPKEVPPRFYYVTEIPFHASHGEADSSLWSGMGTSFWPSW